MSLLSAPKTSPVYFGSSSEQFKSILRKGAAPTQTVRVMAVDLEGEAAPPTAILEDFRIAEMARKVRQDFHEKLDLGPAKEEMPAAFVATLEEDVDGHNYWRPGLRRRAD
jgi:hypothetical protein